MTMNVKITIGGDVIIYDKGGFWNLVFVTDDNHEVECTIGGIRNNLRIPNFDRVLRLVLGDEQSTENRDWGADADKIFNMSHDDLHGSTSHKSNLGVFHASPAYREIVHLKVPRGTVNATCWYSNYLYGLYPAPATRSYGPAAKLVSLSFSVQNTVGKPALRLIDDICGQSVDGPWPYVHGDFDIILDNDCNGTSTALDFLHYYDWVREAGPRRKYFVAKKDGSAIVCNELGELRQEKESKGIDGNCDPARIFPPPLP
jgi:hypothetical protein